MHGALCYSYSGQCLLSSAIGGRSGNRGMCAQPCRKPYVLLRGEKDRYGRPASLAAQPQRERFLISTRDLCVYRHLDRIVRSPVESLKIEGRMKSPEYVAIVTSIYRRALDAIAKGKWSPSPEDERDLALAFNRDFTEGHLLGARDVMGREMSDNRGVLIGSVASFDVQRGEAAVRLSGPSRPEKGDGLVFLAPGQEMGLVVQKVVQKDGLLRLMTPERVRPGAKVYLTGSTALAKKAQEIIASAKTEIALDLNITWQEGTPLLQARLEDGRAVQVKAAFKMEKAKNQPTVPAADRITDAPNGWNALCRPQDYHGLRRGSFRSPGSLKPAATRSIGKGARGPFGKETPHEGEGREGSRYIERDEPVCLCARPPPRALLWAAYPHWPSMPTAWRR